MTREAMLAAMDATACAERRLWILRLREWLYVRERRAGNLGRDLSRYDPPRYRKCYGCGAAGALDGATATTCPRGCGDPAVRRPSPDAWYQEVYEIWYCTAACAAEAAARHRPVCDQGLRWAAAAAMAALWPGTRVRLTGLAGRPELNGQAGSVVAPKNGGERRGLDAEGRVKVKLDGAAAGSAPARVKYGNRAF